MNEKQTQLIGLFSKKYTYHILTFLETGPKRFGELKEICVNEKMRAQRLREFEKFGLIGVNVKRTEGRAISFYKLSDKGSVILKLIDEIKKIIQ